MAGVLDRGDFEGDARRVRVEILRLAGRLGADSAALVGGMADALADVAATLDRGAGRQSLADRLHAFCGRVEQTYARARTLREGPDVYGAAGR